MEGLTIKIIFRGTRREGATPSRRRLAAVYMESGLPNRVDHTRQVIVSGVKAICSNKKGLRGGKVRCLREHSQRRAQEHTTQRICHCHVRDNALYEDP